MRAVSLFSGAGGFDLGLHRAGVEPVLLCEIDPAARKVLAARFPHVPIHDDVTTLHPKEYDVGPVDLVHGGSPCQDLSVAGRRGGLAGERSGLFWHIPRVAAAVDARWVLWENVAGALTSNGGRDFAAVLWGLTGVWPDVPEDGWRSVGVCAGPERVAVWRLLDARWFGVAQRRRRVFVVVGPRTLARRALQVLLEPESCPRGARPGVEAGQEVAGTLGGGTIGGGPRTDTDRMTFVPQTTGTITAALDNGGTGNVQVENGMLVAFVIEPESGQGADLVGRPLGPDDPAPSPPAVAYVKTVRSGARYPDGTLPPERWDAQEVAPTLNAMDNTGESRATVLALSERTRDGGKTFEVESDDVMPSLMTAANKRYALATGTVVRRLTPLECERLMGWPDRWTEPAGAESHRYRLCGNGVVAPVAEWIGRRLVRAWQVRAR